VVIVGAGHGGANAAAMLRRQNYAGEIVLVGDEPELPYDRPPLSKDYVAGKVDRERLALYPPAFYAEQHITVWTGERVAAIQPDDGYVLLAGGEKVHYGQLILATGAGARSLPVPGADLAGVHALRTVADADVLRACFRPGARIVIIGGGYIGLEVAASATAQGATVTVLERESRVLARVAGARLSEFLAGYHVEHGVTIRTSADVAALDGDGSVCAVRLSGNEKLPCDAVLVGVGAVPRDELAVAAGLRCDNGVLVDDCARTSDPSIFAIGDVTRRPLHYREGCFRLESIPSAVEQARRAVSAIVGARPPRPEVPWFWSDQYDLKLQIAGLLDDADQTVVRGDPAGRKFAVFHLRDNRIRAVEAVNSPGEFMMARKLIGGPTELDPGQLGDHTIPLRQLVA
jgi:3-phenylpropionate/trans-cinnamate dioxygenase ferredoxin reductase subunit